MPVEQTTTTGRPARSSPAAGAGQAVRPGHPRLRERPHADPVPGPGPADQADEGLQRGLRGPAWRVAGAAAIAAFALAGLYRAWFVPEALAHGPFCIAAYVQPYLLLLLPSLVFSGAVLFAVGVLVCFVDLARTMLRPAREHGDPWQAPSLEWVPQGSYGMRSIPQVASRDPLWDRPGLDQALAACICSSRCLRK